jgi:lysophospholipase L1-like esterase
MKEFVRSFLLLIVTLAFLAAILEATARIMLDPPSRVNFTGVPKSIKMQSPYPGVRYVLRPNGTATQKFGTDPRNYFDDGAVLTYRTNSLGFRGPEVSPDKPDGTFRIVGLGDSFTFGTGVRNDDTFLSELERILAFQAPETNVEVLNLGAPAYSTTDEIGLLRHKGLTYDPDLVVICLFLNDAGGGGSARQFNATGNDASFWRKSSRLVDYAASLIDRRIAAQALVEAYENSFGDASPGWRKIQTSLREVTALSSEHDFGIMLTIFPVLWSLSDNYPFASIHEKVVDFASSLSIPVIDLQPEFAGYDGPELWVHPNNQHPNEIAHRIAADALARAIMESGSLS